MNTHPDFKELFQLLEKNRVEYMVVGGYAVAFHGFPRLTNDLDVFFEGSAENVARLRRALMEFGFTEADLPEEAFITQGNILTFGVAPSRVDMLNNIDGVTYAEARPNIVRGAYGGIPISFIGRDDLIQNKKATKRAQDKVDADELTLRGQ